MVAVLLHSTLRVFANARPIFRRGILFANVPLRTDWDAAVGSLCDGKTLGTKTIVKAVRGWRGSHTSMNSSDDGLGSVDEFLTGLRTSELVVPAGAGQDEKWVSTLPFSEAIIDGETSESASDAHVRGVKAGVYFMRQGDGPGAAPKGVWSEVWKSFCTSLHESSMEGARPATATRLWDELAAWHHGVRRRHKAANEQRSAANLRAASLPPLRTLEPAILFEV